MTRFFFDGLDLEAIREWRAAGVVTGVTTNSTMLRTAGLSPHGPSFRAVVTEVAPHPIAVMVGDRDVSAIIDEGEQLAMLGDNVVVKVPIIDADGTNNLEAIHLLAERGITVNATACLSLGQVVLAAMAGADYVSILTGRVADEGGDACELLRVARQCVNADTVLLAASVRSAADALRLLTARPDVMTLPAAVLDRLADHRYSRDSVAEFLGVEPRYAKRARR
jgi:transaldolase